MMTNPRIKLIREWNANFEQLLERRLKSLLLLLLDFVGVAFFIYAGAPNFLGVFILFLFEFVEEFLPLD